MGGKLSVRPQLSFTARYPPLWLLSERNDVVRKPDPGDRISRQHNGAGLPSERHDQLCSTVPEGHQGRGAQHLRQARRALGNLQAHRREVAHEEAL